MSSTKHVLTISITFLMILSSCSKNEEDTGIRIPINEDYIIFGNVYGECTGDCRDLYLLADEKLYEDSNNPAQEEVTFNSNELSDEKWKIADTLFVVPQTLSMNSFTQGELIQIIADFDYYIQGKINGVEFKLTYDEIDSTQNIELFMYSENVKDVIDRIK